MSDLRAIGDDVRRLGRVPQVDALVVVAREVWTAAVGEQVAAHSLPVRMSSGALVVHCADSGWVSELTLLEGHVRAKLENMLGQPSPPLRFVVGDVERPDAHAAVKARAVEPSAQQRMQARELASSIVDSELRRAAERAIAASLARDS